MNKISKKLGDLRIAIVCVLFFAIWSCAEQEPATLEDNENYLADNWHVTLKLIPPEDEDYSVTEDSEIKALMLKHGLTLVRLFPNAIHPKYEFFYELTGKGIKDNDAIMEILATGRFEDRYWNFGDNLFPEEEWRFWDDRWVVRLTLIRQTDESYLPTEDPEIQALIEKHGVMLRQIWTMPSTNPDLFLDYDLIGRGGNKEVAIKDFISTGKFDAKVMDYREVEVHPG